MTVDVYLRDNETGYEKMIHDEFEWGDIENAIFYYTEGNGECDCNRSLMLYDHDESKELPCNGVNRRIELDKLVNHETGEDLLEVAA